SARRAWKSLAGGTLINLPVAAAPADFRGKPFRRERRAPARLFRCSVHPRREEKRKKRSRAGARRSRRRSVALVEGHGSALEDLEAGARAQGTLQGAERSVEQPQAQHELVASVDALLEHRPGPLERGDALAVAGRDAHLDHG